MGLKPASRALSDRLIFSRTAVVAGVRIKGTLLVVNHGSKPINLNHGCRPAYEVVLTGRHYRPSLALADICSVKPFILRPGRNLLPFTLLTTFQTCAGKKDLASGEHACLPGPRMPPLPAGHYSAVLVGDGLALPAPVPVAVTLG
jgi:hypothetical protein